jgi:hypothetical protein
VLDRNCLSRQYQWCCRSLTDQNSTRMTMDLELAMYDLMTTQLVRTQILWGKRLRGASLGGVFSLSPSQAIPREQNLGMWGHLRDSAEWVEYDFCECHCRRKNA